MYKAASSFSQVERRSCMSTLIWARHSANVDSMSLNFPLHPCMVLVTLIPASVFTTSLVPSILDAL